MEIWPSTQPMYTCNGNNTKIMKPEKIRINELAPCGVYCGACPSFNKTCKGCASEDRNQKRQSKFSCEIRICCYEEKGLDFCIECNQYPCKKIKKKFINSHPDDPKYTYRHETPAVIAKLKTMGLDDFLEFQKKRWQCKSCEGTVQFYHYKCDTCEKERMIE